MGQVNGIAQENPSPTDVRAYLIRRFRRKNELLTGLVPQVINFVGIGILHHNREVISLWFNIIRINI